jgi:hypothetical protein
LGMKLLTKFLCWMVSFISLSFSIKFLNFFKVRQWN